MRAIITNEDVGTTIDFRYISTHEAQHPWPEETVVSAGEGVVFVRQPKEGEPNSYVTLFMEVYPPGAGFIRGEGATPAECEDAAWAKYQLALYCVDGTGAHPFTPGRYTNGGGVCEKCKTFRSNVFTGAELGQFCKICRVGTTHHSHINEAGETEHLCEDHYVAADDPVLRKHLSPRMLKLLFGVNPSEQPDAAAETAETADTTTTTTPKEESRTDE